MKVWDNYSQYLNERKNYEDWKRLRNTAEAKRAAYVNNVGVPDEQIKSDIKRAEAVLNSIDVMDEFSQTRAEDMEIVTGQAKSIIYTLGMYASTGVGVLLYAATPLKKNLNMLIKEKQYGVIPKLILPAVAFLTPMLAGVIGASAWGAGKEAKASRLGRAESINKILYSPNQFAELTDEQDEQVNEIIKDIHLTPKEAKKMSKASGKGIGVFKSVKTLFAKNGQEQKTIDKINTKTESDKNYFDTFELSDIDEREAKRDQQLIQNIVEKIDISSQNYAEDVELMTGSVTAAALAGGVLTGIITNKILKKIPKLIRYNGIISAVVGLLTLLPFSIYSARLQKQASRVGRFKVKQDFQKNPEKLIYVDDEKAKNQDGTGYTNEEKRPGYFRFLGQVIKNNKEYEKYLKNEYVDAKKKSMAREQLELTEEQKTRAEQLQANVFKMFNKLDEKSQNFSESTEAIGEIASGGLEFVITMLGSLLTASKAAKALQKGAKGKALAITYTPMGISLLIAILINVYITREQKRASKVANMLAIKDLSDYRNFVNYEGKIRNQEISSRSETAN